MGMLFNERTQERLFLRAEHVFGRNRDRADTCFAEADVSSIQAVARWRDGEWVLINHGRNGTTADGQVLAQGEKVVLQPSQTLSFGSGARCQWQVVDVCPPCAALLPLNPQALPIVLTRNQLLPEAESPELSIYQASSGHWLLESDGEARRISDGEPLQLGGEIYHLLLAETIDDTVDSGRLSSLAHPQLHFVVSDDEEHVQLRVDAGECFQDLGERSHHYCLLTLARKRLSDLQSGLQAPSQGWIRTAELAEMLRLSQAHLNIQIYRARHQLMSALPKVPELAELVERRRGALRLGELAFDITRGLDLVGRYDTSGSGAPGPRTQ